jgi:uncharacterized membrane protein YeaQ/YmgE (transglycosylase-associated protein family)
LRGAPAGAAGDHRRREVIEIERLPLLGKGKVDYPAVARLGEQFLSEAPRGNGPIARSRLKSEGRNYRLWAIVIGFLAGAIAKLFSGGPRGFVIITLLGMIGTIFAAWLGQHIRCYEPGQRAGFIGAIVGAALILVIYRAVVGPPP